jgi:cyclase
MRKTDLPESRHFILHNLADSVFAAIAKEGGSAICNAGLINLGGQILVFDTFLTPQAARDLRRAAFEIYGQTPRIVINSHYHNDHIWGNQVFLTEAQIISSTRTRELIATAGMEEFQWYSSNSAQQLESFRTRYQDANDEQKQQLLLWISYYEGLVEALPNLIVTMSGITFNRHLEIHGDKHSVKLITFEGAHTGSDTVLHLPQERILFMGDLLFVGCHPYLADGDPLQLLKALRELSQLDAAHFIPGHGPVGTLEDLKLLMEYIDYCLTTAQELVQRGDGNEAGIAKLKMADRYHQWQQPQFFSANMAFLCKRLSLASSDKQAT